MPNIRLIIEYDGADFSGWQSQPHRRTIQGELTRVLSLVTRQNIDHVQASGRTDAGVHAKAQVVNFHVEKEVDLHVLKHAVSSILKGEVAVICAEYVPDGFHSLRDAVKKQYCYSILNRPAPAVFDRKYCWHISRNLDLEYLNQQAKLLIGVHDFTSLRAADCTAATTVREIYRSEFIREGEYLRYFVCGQGFLKNMVRIIVGTLIDLERKRLGEKNILDVLELRDRRFAGVTAPAHGLYLDWVEY